MENQRRPLRIHISVAALLENQLSQWQQLLIELEEEGVSTDSLAYCQTQIEQLTRKAQNLTLLNNGSQN